MRGNNLPEAALDKLAGTVACFFPSDQDWIRRLSVLGLTELTITPDPGRVGCEGALREGCRLRRSRYCFGRRRPVPRRQNRIRRARQPAAPSAAPRGPADSRPRTPRNPAPYQRVGKRNPRLRDKTKNLRQVRQRTGASTPGRHARPVQVLREAQNPPLRLPRSPPR